MEKDKTTGKPDKLKPETVTEKQSVEATEKLETQQDSEEKDETATSETGDQSEAENAKPQTETEKLKVPATPDIRAQQAKDAAFIAPYANAYPKEKAFHVTSDRQVFLERDRGLAVLHQTSLDNGEKIQTIKVK